MKKYRLWQCLHGCIVSLHQYYSNIETSEDHILLINLIRRCIRIEWAKSYLIR